MMPNKMRWLAVALLCLVLWPAQAQVAAEPEREKWAKIMQTGAKAFEQSDFAEAERQFKAGLKVAEEGLGPTDRAVLSTHKILARMYLVLGRQGDAETATKRILELQEKIHGPMHPNIAAQLNNLAEIYRRQKK